MLKINNIQLKEIPLKTEETKINQSKIKKFFKLLQEELKEISQLESQEITELNKEGFLEKILIIDNFIKECHTAKEFNCARSQDFIRLTYNYQNLALRYERYKYSQDIIKIREEAANIEDRQKNIEESSNNLVYNILSFILSFSIISAVVGTINQIQGTINIMLFMCFTLFILLTTLIGIHNFYKNGNKIQSKLQDNYFLWEVVVAIIVIMSILSFFDKIDITQYIF